MSLTTTLGYTPRFDISKGGENITAAFQDRLVSLSVESREGGGSADVCQITLDDRDWAIALPSIGENSATLAVAMGFDEGVLYEMGTFQVDRINLAFPPKAITLNGNSVGFDTGIKAPLIVAHDGKTLGEILNGIATTAGVTAAVDPDLAAIKVPYLNQHSTSGHLLRELERRFNGLAKFGEGKLSFTKRGSGESVSGTSIGNFVLGPEDFASLNIELSNRNSYLKVRASWWDKDKHEQTWLTSAIAGNPGSDVPFMLKRLYPSQSEAQKAADAHMSQMNRQAKQGTVTLAKGDPSIRGGQGFAIAGTRDGLDGSYLIRIATHTLTKEGGLTTTLSVYDEGDGIDFSTEATDGETDFSGTGIIPANETPVMVSPTAGGVGSA